MKNYGLSSAIWRTVFDVENKKKKLGFLEKEIQKPGLWENQTEAVRITKELSDLRQEIIDFESIKTEGEEEREVREKEEQEKAQEQKI